MNDSVLSRWIQTLKERFPLPVYALLCGGLTLSTGSLVIIPFLITLSFFLTLRLMDEVKDYEKDCIVHPDRPLPRGLLTVDEAKKGILILLGLMGAAAGALLFFGYQGGGLAFLITIGYLYLMYWEFFVGEKLSHYPIFYALTHQVILYPLTATLVWISSPTASILTVFQLGTLFLAGFFIYEICRKLDPRAHPLLETYLFVYGQKKTLFLVIGLIAISYVSALFLGVYYLILPVNFAVVVTAGITLTMDPTRFKTAEIAASVSLIAHVWAPFIFQIAERFG